MSVEYQTQLSETPAHLATLLAFIQDGVEVAGLAEKFLLENDVVQVDVRLADGAGEAGLVPGQHLPALTRHLHPACRERDVTISTEVGRPSASWRPHW